MESGWLARAREIYDFCSSVQRGSAAESFEALQAENQWLSTGRNQLAIYFFDEKPDKQC